MAGIWAHLTIMNFHHDHASKADKSPVALPLAVITVDTYGALSVMLDGAEYPPPAPAAPWSKARFGELLDALTVDRTRSVRVEVHEDDGSTFTDIIHAARTPRSGPRAEAPAKPHRRARHRQQPEMIEVTGAGFAPGEDAIVAVVLTRTEATANGTASAHLNPAQVSEGGEVLLVGEASARVVVRRVP